MAARCRSPLRIRWMSLAFRLLSVDWRDCTSGFQVKRSWASRRVLAAAAIPWNISSTVVLTGCLKPPSRGRACGPEIREAAARWLALARAAVAGVEPGWPESQRRSSISSPVFAMLAPNIFSFEQSRLTGIVDFGAMAVDCISGDLARLIGDWPGGDATPARQPRRPTIGFDHFPPSSTR